MKLELRPDGQPADQKTRAALLRLRTIVRTQRGRKISQVRGIDILATILSRRAGMNAGQSPELWEAAVEAEILVEGADGLFHFKGGERGRTAADRVARFEEMVAAVAGRLCVTDEGRLKASSLIRRYTRLHGAHKVSLGSWKGIFVASDMAMDENGPTMLRGKVIILTDTGIVVRTVQARGVSVVWENDWPVVSISLGWTRTHKTLTAAISDDEIVPRGFGYSSASVLSDMSDKALGFIKNARADFERLVGEPLTQRKWRGFLMSLGKRRPIGQLISMTLLGMLDPQARRFALRIPGSTLKTYLWLMAADPEKTERRLQASDAFPLFTSLIKKLEKEIDEGRPLLPALARETGLSVPQIRVLSGVHWQRLGAMAYAVKGVCRFSCLNGILPERLPRNRKEWQAWGRLSEQSWIPKEKLRDVISANWSGYGSLLDADFLHAVEASARDLRPLVTGFVLLHGDRAEYLRETIISQVCGDKFGLKRMRRFNDDWHKGQERRATALRQIRKDLFGITEAAKWPALTEEEFECVHGRLQWLTDEDQLVVEGQTLRHCVGSYSRYCIEGTSHIAAVMATDGSRSTVEFGIGTEGRLVLRQHQAFMDTPPLPGSNAVVSAFMSKVRKQTFKVVRGDDSAVKRARGIVDVTPAVVEGIIAAYSDCLPESFLRSLVTAAQLQVAA